MASTTTVEVMSRSRIVVVFAFGMASTVAAVGAIVGYGAANGLVHPADDPAADLSFLGIVAANVPAVLLLFSGVVTAGLASVVGVLLISGYVGATLAAAAANVGLARAVGSIVAYAPIEFGALLIAAAAGLLPVCAAYAAPSSARLAVYRDTLGQSLRMVLVAVVAVILGAFVESMVMAGRS